MLPYFYDTVKGAARTVMLLSAHILTTLTVGVFTSPDVVMQSGSVRHILGTKSVKAVRNSVYSG